MKRLIFTKQTIRILTARETTLVIGGAVPTSKQPGCTDDGGKTIVRTARC